VAAAVAGKTMAARIPKYLLTLFYLTLGFGAVVAGFFIAGEMASGWDRLSHVIYGMGVAALWALVSVIYLIWILTRDGCRKSAIPAVFFIIVITGFSAFLILGEY
jgi:hypothetical protein